MSAQQPATDAAGKSDGRPSPASPPIVRVRCESCGPRVVALSSVRLLGRDERWEYAFTCTGCGSRTVRSADAALQAVLRDAGAAELIVYSSADES